ncbi:hypothetical protein NUSPORA_00261 [Nucleospora cyclopteri]
MLFVFLRNIKSISETSIENLNDTTYDIIDKISKTDRFSKVKLNFYEKCPRMAESCKATSCAVTTIKYKDKEGYLDLLKTVESFSPSVKRSNEVWSDIYAAMPNESLIKIVSGLHFSVTTHIAAFHTKFFNFFISHPRHFQQKYKQEYKDNFMELYMIIRAAVGNLKNTPSKIYPELNDLIDKIGDQNVPKIDISSIESINKIVECIACLNCEKCRIWGTIQTRGLRSMVKSINNKKLYKEDIIYLINLYRRVSETVRQSKRLQSISYPSVYILLIYYKEFGSLFIFVLLLVLIKLKIRQKNSKKDALKFKFE